MAITAAIAAGCHSHDQEPGHDHASEEAGLESLVYTLYTDSTELFVEFKPLVVGEESRFAAHFTQLGAVFTPLTEGQIDLTLDVNGKKTKISSTEPQVPGIFRLALTPDQAGKAKLTFHITTAHHQDEIVIEGLTVYANEADALADAKEVEDAEITYLKEQAWKVEFAHEAVRKQPFRDVLKTSGQLLSAPGDERVVVASASGIVRFDGGSVVGSSVNEGETLFVITGGELADGNMDAAYQQSKANYEKAKADHDRSKALIKDRIISQQVFSETQVAFEHAETAFKTISKNYSTKGQRVMSPMRGFIKQLMVSEGAFVETGTALATISKNEKLLLQANVSQKHFERLAKVVSANFKRSGSDEVLNTNELGGKVISYGRSASAHAPFIPVLFEIENRGGLIPGSVVEVYLRSTEIADALVIPTSALMEEQGRFYVFVQVSGEGFDKRELSLGANDGAQVQVLSGLKEGDRVVTKGAYNIKLSVASGTLPAQGHEH